MARSRQLLGALELAIYGQESSAAWSTKNSNLWSVYDFLKQGCYSVVCLWLLGTKMAVIVCLWLLRTLEMADWSLQLLGGLWSGYDFLKQGWYNVVCLWLFGAVLAVCHLSLVSWSTRD